MLKFCSLSPAALLDSREKVAGKSSSKPFFPAILELSMSYLYPLRETPIAHCFVQRPRLYPFGQRHRCICVGQAIAYIREGAANIAAPNLYHFDQYKPIFFGPQLQNPHRFFFCRTVYLYVSTGLKPAPNPQGYLLHSRSLRLTESIPA